jgi:MYXO-CTERM domain-containing protein
MRSFAIAVALGAGLAMTRSLSADTQIESFDNFTLDNKYANWGAPTAVLNSGPTSFDVQAKGYGSGYKYLGPPIDASADNTVQLDATVNAGTAGFVIDISDANNNGLQYAWYGLTPGGGVGGGNEYILTMPISAGTFFGGTGMPDWTNITQLNIGVDPGAFASVPYSVSFNDLSTTTVAAPEPAGLGLVALGMLLAARRRRR